MSDVRLGDRGDGGDVEDATVKAGFMASARETQQSMTSQQSAQPWADDDGSSGYDTVRQSRFHPTPAGGYADGSYGGSSSGSVGGGSGAGGGPVDMGDVDDRTLRQSMLNASPWKPWTGTGAGSPTTAGGGVGGGYGSSQSYDSGNSGPTGSVRDTILDGSLPCQRPARPTGPARQQPQESMRCRSRCLRR
ncbi:hypothetical protein BC831DRAFT_208638 [Entophlyctis helioformis]|nr:hypothetical protein BC831DRAFT_208638 [Entophlyctis helioformis]